MNCRSSHEDRRGSTVGERPGALRCLGDQALLEAVGGAAPRAALQELFRRHGAVVHRLASLLVVDPTAIDGLVADVFVTVARRRGRLEDDVENVRLGLLAMAWRRSRPTAGEAPDREAVALTILAAATLTEVATVLQADRRVVGVRVRDGLLSAAA